MEFEFDAFVSYRRSDGARVARRLRRALLDYRLPSEIRVDGRVLSVYFDRIYERATDDFFEKTLKPALSRSRHLILVVTPDALAPRSDGAPNWVEREVEHFLGLPQHEQIHVIIGKGDLQEGLPARLAALRPNIQRLDLRSFDRPWSVLTRDRWRAADELLGLLATLYDVPVSQMPLLRDEAARVKLRRAWAWATGISLTALTLAGVSVAAAVGWWRAVEREAVASSQAMALRAEVLKPRSLDRAFALTLRAFETAPTATAEAALRAHLDSLPLLASAPLVQEARSLVVSPEIERVFTAGDKGGTRVSPVGSGSAVEVPGYFVGESADGTVFATTRGEVVTLYRTSDGSIIRAWCDARTVHGLSSDGRRLAVQNQTDVRVLDVVSGDEVWRAAVERDGLVAMQLAPAGDQLLQVEAAGKVRWLPVTPEAGPAFSVEVKGQPFVTVTRDGRLAAVGGGDGSVVLVDTRQGRELWRGRPHSGPVRALHFTPDGGHLVSVGEGSGLAALDTRTLARHNLGGALASEVTGIHAWSPDGRRVLAKHPDGPMVLSYPHGAAVGLLRGHTADLSASAFSVDSARVITASKDLSVRQWRVADASNSASIPTPAGGALQMLWLPGNRSVALAGRRGEVVVWDGHADAGRRTMRHGPDAVLTLAVDAQGTAIAGGGHDGRVVVWSLPAGRVLFDVKVSDAPIESVAFGSDPKEVVVGDRNGEVRRCRLVAGDCEALAKLVGPVAQIEFDPAARRWHTASFGAATSWSETWSVIEQHDASNFGLMRMRRHPRTKMLAFAGKSERIEIRAAGGVGGAFHVEGLRAALNDFVFSPDGDRIAVASASTGVRIWSLKTRQVETTLFGLKGSASSVAWSPDGSRVAAAGDDEAGLWDVESGALLARFRGQYGRDGRAAFAADGKRLAIAGRGGRVHVFDLDRRSLLEAARAHATAIEPVLAGTRWVDLWDVGPVPSAHPR